MEMQEKLQIIFDTTSNIMAGGDILEAYVSGGISPEFLKDIPDDELEAFGEQHTMWLKEIKKSDMSMAEFVADFERKQKEYWEKQEVKNLERGLAVKAARLNRPEGPSKYEFTEEMGEISGFGGGYEETCRGMLIAGLEWFDEHPDAEPEFQEFDGIFGVIDEVNDDAKDLTKAIVDASDGDCTGAMHQVVVGTTMWIRKNGWDEYVRAMSKEVNGDKSNH